MASHKEPTIKTVAAYTTAPWDHALAVLRIVAPLREAGIEPVHGNPGGQIDYDKVSQADLVLVQRDFPSHLQAYERIRSLARMQKKPIVLDLDDWLLELPDNHPDRISHHYAGGLFPILRAIMEADGVTVSTAQLAERLNSLNDNIWVLPNCIDERLWHLHPRQENTDPQQPLTIVYMGGDSHAPDFDPLVPLLSEILQMYGERLKFKSIGMQPAPMLQALSNVEAIPFHYAYPAYAEFVQGQHFDIAIAPLADNLFNRCKSSMKYLEYSALGIPAVYSRITPYAGLITDGDNGILASDLTEWRQAIIRLLEDAPLRSRMGAAAQESVRQNWLLSEHAPEWARAYQQAASSIRQEKTHATLPLALFADLTRQNRLWEQALETRLVDMHQTMRLEERLSAGKNPVLQTRKSMPLSRWLARITSRMLKWISSRLRRSSDR